MESIEWSGVKFCWFEEVIELKIKKKISEVEVDRVLVAVELKFENSVELEQ
jgi:hypothetical protein